MNVLDWSRVRVRPVANDKADASVHMSFLADYEEALATGNREISFEDGGVRVGRWHTKNKDVLEYVLHGVPLPVHPEMLAVGINICTLAKRPCRILLHPSAQAILPANWKEYDVIGW